MPGDAPSFEQLERTIGSVAGVAAAHVVRGGHGGGRLRIRLEPGEDAGRVSWAVAATLRERFGIALDPDDIRPLVAPGASPDLSEQPMDASEPRPDARTSVAESAVSDDLADAVAAALHDLATRGLDDDGGVDGGVDGNVDGDPPMPIRHAILTPQVPDQPGAEPGEPATIPPRAIIRDLLVSRSRDQVEVTAILGLGAREVAGEAIGPASAQGALRASAEATLEALRALTGGLLHAGIDHVTVSQGDDVEAATVVLTVLSEEHAEELLGAALLRGEPELAVMRATLDALNRRISRWLQDAATDERD